MIDRDDDHDHRLAPFDYSQLDDDLAARANRPAVHAAAEVLHEPRWLQDTPFGHYRMDRLVDLLEMKEALGHGHFGGWIVREVKFSPASARNYMSVAREFGGTPLIIGVLPLSIVYRLAGTGESVRSAVLAQVEAGERVNPDAVRELSEDHKAKIAREKKSHKKRAKEEATEKRRRQREATAQRKQDQVNEEHSRAEASMIEEAVIIIRRWNATEDELMRTMNILRLISMKRIMACLAT